MDSLTLSLNIGDILVLETDNGNEHFYEVTSAPYLDRHGFLQIDCKSLQSDEVFVIEDWYINKFMTLPV